MLKSSYKSSSTNSLYEFAEELSSFDATNAKKKKELSAQTKTDTLTYSMEFPTNAHAHTHNTDVYDIVD